MQYYYKIVYKKGKENQAADALSRLLELNLFSLTLVILPIKQIQKIKDTWEHDL